MSARRKPMPRLPAAADPRKRLLAKVHAMAKELALSDDSYRDVLRRITGQRSAALCSDEQLYQVVQEFTRLGAGKKRSGRPIADSPMALRCRALWITLWNLDELDDGSEHALASFVRRQTGREDMRFCTAEQLSDVIEALKDMCSRAGIDMSRGASVLVPKRNLVREQWARLHASGWARINGDSGLAGFAHSTWCTPNARTVEQMEAAHLDKLASKLGQLVRSGKLGRRRDQVDAC